MFSFVGYARPLIQMPYAMKWNDCWQTLKKATGLTTTDVTSHKLTQLDEKTVADLEDLLSDWINTVESNIVDDTAVRFVKLIRMFLAWLQGLLTNFC
jgi:hypothetical protein